MNGPLGPKYSKEAYFVTCKYCGADVPENAVFCPKCGGIVDSAEEIEERDRQEEKELKKETAEIVVTAEPAERPKSVSPEQPRKRTGLIIALSIIAALLVACLSLVLLDYFEVIELPIIDLLQTASCQGQLPTGADKAPTIEPDTNNPGQYLVTVYAKAGTKLIYETSHGNRQEVEVPMKGHVVFSVPEAGLIPQEPIEGETCSVIPIVYAVDENGAETRIEGFNPVVISVPALNVVFDSDTITAESGSAVISGIVVPVDASVTLEGEALAVGQDGRFSQTVSFSEAGEYTVSLEARLAGYSIFRHSVTVIVEAPAEGFIQFPWEYGDDTFSQRVKNDADTPLDVWGRVPAGSKVSVSCEDEGVELTDPTVDGDGNFAFTVKLPYVGNFALNITCESFTGTVTERVLHVQRAPEWRSYVEGSWAMSYEDLSYASKHAYKIGGTVTEVLEESDCIVVLLELADGRDIVLRYYNHYPNAGSLAVGSVHTGIYGRPVGKNDDGLPEVYVWFIID